MSEDKTQASGEYTTWADFNMKSILLNQYVIAYNNVVDYLQEPKKGNLEINARKSILKLLFPLYPKLYVLGEYWKEKRDYLSYFMWNPQECHLLEIQAAFLILQRVMEKLGITKFEKYQLSAGEIFNEE